MNSSRNGANRLALRGIVAAMVAAIGWSAFGEVTPTDLPIDKTPWMHIDASNATTLVTEKDPGTGVTVVKSARDASGGERSVTSATTGATTLGDWKGMPYFDFGPYFNPATAAGAGFNWSEECSTVREVFLVVMDRDGDNEGFFVGGSSSIDFHRGSAGALFLGGNASSRVLNGRIEIDGEAATAETVFPFGFHVLRVQTTDYAKAGTFSIDRKTTRKGGTCLAEAVVFDEPLTDEAAKSMTDYLIGKWKTVNVVEPTKLPIDKKPWLHIDANNETTLETRTDPDTGAVMVTRAKDASGGTRAVNCASTGMPTLGSCLGMPCFDFGPYCKPAASVGAGFKWSEECSTVREVFLVVKDRDGDNEGFFVGGASVDFHRGSEGMLFLKGNASSFVLNGRIEIDGEAATAGTVYPSGLHLLRVQTTDYVKAGAFSIDRETQRKGGTCLSEAVVFDEPLTDEEAAAMTDYLIDKWLTPKDCLVVELSKNMPVPEGLDLGCGEIVGLQAGDKRTLTTPSVWTNELEKFVVTCKGWKLYDGAGLCLSEGPGATVEYEHPTPAAERRLVWQVVPRHVGVTPPPVDDAAFAVDASCVNCLTMDDDAHVIKWADARFGRGYALQSSKNPTRLPVLGAVNGRPFVDFGALGKSAGCCLDWFFEDRSIREVFWVYSDYPGDTSGGFLLGSLANTYDFHRDGKHLFGGSPSVRITKGLVQLDGKTVPYSTELPEGFHVIRVQTTDVVSAGAFGNDRNIADRFGGQRLSEVLVYDRALSDAEAAETTAYLMSKWHKLGAWDDAVMPDDSTVELFGGAEAAKTLYTSRRGYYKLAFSCSGDAGTTGQTLSIAIDDGPFEGVAVLGDQPKVVSTVFNLTPGLHAVRLKNMDADVGRKMSLGAFEVKRLDGGLMITVD